MKKIIYFFIFFVIGINLPLSAQTTLAKGDIVLLGINANYENCNNEQTQAVKIVDKIYLVPLVDLQKGTSFIITDNGWERKYDNYFGTTEGVLKFTAKKVFPKGEVIILTITNTNNSLGQANPDWTVNSLNSNNYNFNFAKEDQFFLVDGNNKWSTNGEHKGKLEAKPYLFAFNNKLIWQKNNTDTNNTDTHNSALPSENSNNDYKDLKNFQLSLLDEKTFTSFHYYNGPKTVTSRNQWMIRLLNPENWKSEQNCTDFLNNFTPHNLEINEILGEKTVCKGENITLEIEADGDVSIQNNITWYRSSQADLSNPTQISSVPSNPLTVPANVTGTFYYFAKINYTLKYKKIQNGTMQAHSAVVNSGYYKVTINSVETSLISSID